MAITAQDVNKLRQMTGAGMMDCKKALTEAEGDFEKAVDILRKKGQKVSASRADRETKEGVVVTRVADGGAKGILLSLTCETDFVAKNEEFGAFANTLIDLAVNNGCTATEQILALPFDSITVAEKIIEMTGKIGEKIEISHYEVINAEKVVTYIHSNGKLGVLVGMVNTSGADVEEAGKDVAMQIAAMNPVAVDKDGVDASMIEREIEIGKEQARAEGKPEEMLEKIAMGKLQKFYKESTLLSQQFVKDNSLSIAQYLNNVSKGLTVNAFKRISIG
ncbi:elongation factor Ts [Algoriphagus aquaeductus]|jgi:elongation factor Ts|uniref:Elongation factor Ts n=1 Tax=Algoriphagus aquaeductus TaxID=475299 RepID=A0A326RNA6_9BACT|nr:translation elongation factor Ts [Algoriphagus aquaeductus]MCU0399929.1 translation elongation factor Ts [Algoriphagus sp.]OYX22311.1 MAG: translation elongation factor Ts [Algoriphagus sp. 32-45-6]PZV82860.1 elongation factor Ts [Algoriphagus aquaeductus]